MELEAWAERFGLVAGITTRGPAGSTAFNLGLWSEEAVGQVMTRWRAFRAALGDRFPAVILSHQVHGSNVGWHTSATPGWHLLDGLDAHATALPGTLLTITVADCIPVYLAVPTKRVVALVHAGWRGTAARILERAVELLRREAFCRGSDIVMHCGVGICGGCYEVGSEVAVRFGMSGTVKLDLREVLARQARALGIADITVSPWCSAEGRDRFFSHRGSRGRDGRMVAYLGRPLG